MNKKQLSERDICTKFITPALEQAGWDVTTQILEEFPLTKGRIIVRGKLHTRAKHKRADYVLFYKPNIPIAIIEAKDNSHSVGDGMQQALTMTARIPMRGRSRYPNRWQRLMRLKSLLRFLPKMNNTASSPRSTNSWPVATNWKSCVPSEIRSRLNSSMP